MIGFLVVYCLKDAFAEIYYALPEPIAVSFIVTLHKWRKNTQFSIGGGTVLYARLNGEDEEVWGVT